MTDNVWQEALAEIAHLPKAAQAYRLGELYAWQWTKKNEVPTGAREAARMDDAWLRLEGLVEKLGEQAYDLFDDAFAAVTGDDAVTFAWRAERAEFEAWREREGGCNG